MQRCSKCGLAKDSSEDKKCVCLPRKNLLNKQFGKLTVVEHCGVIEKNNRVERCWLVKCQCGVEKMVSNAHLVRKKNPVISCGCLNHRKGPIHPQWSGYGEISGNLWNQIKRHSGAGRGVRKRRQLLEFTIKIEDAWEVYKKQNGRCNLTGLSISFDKPRTASLDRIDNNIGYVLSNIQWVHRDINFMKNKFSQERFIEICKLITNPLEVR